MRVRNDELGRGPSHDEVETLLCKTLDEAGHGEAEVRALAVQLADALMASTPDRTDTEAWILLKRSAEVLALNPQRYQSEHHEAWKAAQRKRKGKLIDVDTGSVIGVDGKEGAEE